MRGLHCQELIGQLRFRKDVLPLEEDIPVRCQSMFCVPMAPEYCVTRAPRISIKVGLWQLDRAGAMQEVSR